MKTIEQKLAIWLNSKLYRNPSPVIRENKIVDLLEQRRLRLLVLREIAQEIAAECHDCSKLYQADRLISEVTARMNNRFHHSNRFNFN
jgi:hypothetical protein